MPRFVSLIVLSLGVVLFGAAAFGSASAWLAIGGALLVGVVIGNVIGKGSGRSQESPAGTLATRGGFSRATPDPVGGRAVDLEDLELRCKVRGDFETAGLIDRLQALSGRLRECEAAAGADSLDLTMKMRKMYDNAAAFCERALSLHLARREMVTDEARAKVDEQRRALLDEIAAAVGAIENGVDRLRAAAATAGDADRREELADLNGDLDRRLEVARKVEQRMADLEADARGDYSKAAAFVEGR